MVLDEVECVVEWVGLSSDVVGKDSCLKKAIVK